MLNKEALVATLHDEAGYARVQIHIDSGTAFLQLQNLIGQILGYTTFLGVWPFIYIQVYVYKPAS